MVRLPLTFWSKISGPPVTLSNTGTSALSLTGISVGNYTFRLVATDNLGTVSPDDVNIIANFPPNNYNFVRESAN